MQNISQERFVPANSKLIAAQFKPQCNGNEPDRDRHPGKGEATSMRVVQNEPAEAN